MPKPVTLRDVYEIVERIEDKLDKRIDSVEKRVETMETIGTRFDPNILVPKIYASETWIHDFRLTYKVLIGLAIVVSSIIGFVAALVSQVVGLIKS